MSLFPTLQRLSPKATLLYDCFPGLLTRETPNKWYPASPPSTSAWQKFSGTDPITGFAPPTGAPFFCPRYWINSGRIRNVRHRSYTPLSYTRSSWFR